MSETPRVLIVDDDDGKRLALAAALKPLGLSLVEANSGFDALRQVMMQDFAVILLDVCMPTMNGFETAALIRQRTQSEMTPIIFLTVFEGDDALGADHYSEGAVDFIVAPFDPKEIRAKVTVFANLHAKAAALAAHSREVQTSADQLRLLTDAAPIGIFQTDAANRYVYTNPRWSQITGIAPEDAAGKPWEGLFGPDRGVDIGAEVTKGPESRPELSQHLEIPCHGSAPRVVLVTAASIPATDGGRAGWVGTVADVTAEAEAEAASSHFRAVIESSHDAIISKDLNEVITSWNAGAERLYGYTAAEAVGELTAMLMPPGHDDESSELLSRVRLGELVDDYETMRKRKDGQVVDVSLTTSPILGPQGDVVGASIIARDISDRRKAEQLKDEFLAMVSHELRTPLSSIVAHTELLLDEELVDTDIRRNFMEVIDRNSVRLERLVGDLLFVAQLESANLSLSMTNVDIVEVATEAVEAMSVRALQSGNEVRLVAPLGKIMLTGDPGRLGQAIDNLISNAIKYSPDGGIVTVRILPADDECTIEIEDHGIGIATDDHEHLFDRFFRGSTAVNLHIPGVGLGLSIVKRIVDGHGGRVGVHSGPGHGAIFTLAIPTDDFRLRLGLPSSPSHQEAS
jgi:PAS domain S-box-containing protein